jgi:sigma-B regulation protein RsbU (phosphoserine phosphatase)
MCGEEPMKSKLDNYSMDIVNGMIDWVRVIDINHTIVFMNKSMKEKIGDFVGKKCYQGIGLTSPCPDCISEETLRTGKIHIKEEAVGSNVYSVASSPIMDDDEKICGAVEVFRDITREKTLEQSLMEQNKKLNANLCFAKMLQQRLLPEKGKYNDYLSIDYSYIPSEMLGGDLFDVFPIDDQQIAVYIFDISGHGVMSSMLTMFVRQTVRALAEEGRSPSMVLQGLLDKFLGLGLDDENFITILFGVYSPKEKTFIYANGGHNPPILLRKSTARVVYGAGLPVCSLATGNKYQEYNLALEKDDCIYLYTDGITEARNASQELFGIKRLIQAIERYDSINGIIESVETFAKDKLSDDVAMLAIKVL